MDLRGIMPAAIVLEKIISPLAKTLTKKTLNYNQYGAKEGLGIQGAKFNIRKPYNTVNLDILKDKITKKYNTDTSQLLISIIQIYK